MFNEAGVGYGLYWDFFGSGFVFFILAHENQRLFGLSDGFVENGIQRYPSNTVRQILRVCWSVPEAGRQNIKSPAAGRQMVKHKALELFNLVLPTKNGLGSRTEHGSLAKTLDALEMIGSQTLDVEKRVKVKRVRRNMPQEMQKVPFSHLNIEWQFDQLTPVP